MSHGTKLWKGRKHYLDKMTLSELVQAYFAYPAIQAYLALTLISVGVTLYLGIGWVTLGRCVIAALLIYPLGWYLVHRFVLHGQFLYKSPRTAALWKRVHFDHHQDPNDLNVLFGALHTTLPAIALITLLPGWLMGGPAGAAAGFAAGLLITCFYEFCHCIEHLAYTPKRRFLRRMKKRHLAHHFHNERGNYGITNFMPDRVLATYYASSEKVPRSPTVFNLGYTREESERYPWVAQLSGWQSEEEPSMEAHTGN